MITILVGISGSGKSTWAEQNNKNSFVLSADKFRGILGASESDQSVSRQAFEHLNVMCEYMLKYFPYIDIIIDNTSTTATSRVNFIKLAKKYNLSICAVYFNTPLPICIERNAKRERKVPENVIERQNNQLIIPSESEGFNFVMKV